MEEDRDRVKHFFGVFREVAPILDNRYWECDKNGHAFPNEETGYCESCYRQLHYTAPRINERLK